MWRKTGSAGLNPKDSSTASYATNNTKGTPSSQLLPDSKQYFRSMVFNVWRHCAHPESQGALEPGALIGLDDLVSLKLCESLDHLLFLTMEQLQGNGWPCTWWWVKIYSHFLHEAEGQHSPTIPSQKVLVLQVEDVMELWQWSDSVFLQVGEYDHCTCNMRVEGIVWPAGHSLQKIWLPGKYSWKALLYPDSTKVGRSFCWRIWKKDFAMMCQDFFFNNENIEK